MQSRPDFPVRVFYDGSCVVCAAEIGYYLGKDHAGRLVAVDISAEGFDPAPFRIPLETFMHELHVIDSSGTVFRGVEAFRAIWQAFPGSALYGSLCTLLSLPLINPLARLSYRCFARIRPWLPKRHSCSSTTCGIGRR